MVFAQNLDKHFPSRDAWDLDNVSLAIKSGWTSFSYRPWPVARWMPVLAYVQFECNIQAFCYFVLVRTRKINHSPQNPTWFVVKISIYLHWQHSSRDHLALFCLLVFLFLFLWIFLLRIKPTENIGFQIY